MTPLALACLGFAASASAQTAAPSEPTMASPRTEQTEPDPVRVPAPSDYHLGPRDLVAIQVYEVPDLNVQQRVSENGTIGLPFIGEVRVEGYTQAQLSAELKRLLEAEYVERATVTVDLLELRSRPISILGAVSRPGDLGFSGQWTLLEAIAAAGGLAAGHGDGISVLRRAANGLSDQIKISARDLMVLADPKVNIPLYSGDLISVEREVKISIYLLGEVRQPGVLEFGSTQRITLLSALARAGGLTERASQQLRVRRLQPDGTYREIEAHYKRLLEGKDPDPELEAGDIIHVKESFF